MLLIFVLFFNTRIGNCQNSFNSIIVNCATRLLTNLDTIHQIVIELNQKLYDLPLSISIIFYLIQKVFRILCVSFTILELVICNILYNLVHLLEI